MTVNVDTDYQQQQAAATCSNKTSMSSDDATILTHSKSFSRLSFDLPASSPELNAPLKPHRSSDSSFKAISSRPNLSFRDFSLVRQIGSGDIGRVYVCRLRSGGGSRLYAMKVVDNEVLAAKKKTRRAETERKILRMLDHPFLPTLYAEFEASNFSCVVMEYCSGGDLHSLRHKQPQKRFSVAAARFYAAEVLVALEYLHMLGIIYRDLKPENVLVRSDGHVMLTDFDLSLCSDAIPAVESPLSSAAASSSVSSCFPKGYRLFRSKKTQPVTPPNNNRLSFVAEPVTARSCSFVGTHEYVAPEVASGGSHGNAVDWWAFGIFLYELIYGKTPFVGPSNEATLRNISRGGLVFPTAGGGGGGGSSPCCGSGEANARDLIAGLLCKDPNRRVGSRRGAADVKAHPFFRGMNFALIRTVAPPSVPGKAVASCKETAPFALF